MAIFESFTDLIPGYRFIVDIPGFGSVNFSEVSGLGMEHKTEEYRSGGDYRVKELYMGTKFTDVTLKRGMSNSRQMWDFANSVLNTLSKANPENKQLPEFRVDITIKQLDNTGTVVKRWMLKDAWVKSYQVADMNASQSEVSYETIVLSHSGLALEKPNLLENIIGQPNRDVQSILKKLS